MAKVSIIVPIFNVAQYLRECLESIINQTLEEIEIICVNDGSTDNSLSIIQEYALKDDRIIIIDKQNTGYGHTMNVALSQATGDYIGIVESDDFVDKEMFEKLYNIAEKNFADVVKSNYFEYRKGSDTFVENLKKCTYNYTFDPTEKNNIFFVAPSIWSGIYKRSFLMDNNITFNETPGASYQDTSFAFKVWVSAKRVFLIDDAFLHYRIDNMSSSVNSTSKVFCICDEYKEIRKFLESNRYSNNRLVLLAFAMKFISYKWNYNRLSSAFQYAFLLKMVEEFREAEKNGEISTEYLSDIELNEIYYIINNYNEYFTETSKYDYVDRFLSSSTLNLQIYIKGFFDLIDEYDKIIIFGAGIIGKKVAQELTINNKEIYCFAVSSIINNPKTLFGVDVQCIDDLIKHRNNSIVLVAVREQYQHDVINKLKELNFENVILVDSLLISGFNRIR